jgi:hypothetical protein
MICEKQKNLKVHFAGAESLVRSELFTNCVNANYTLFTIFPFICYEFGIPHGFFNANKDGYKNVSKSNYINSKHSIQDSGIFSLVHGSYKGDKSKNFIDKYYNKLIELTLNNEFKGTVVELDCQKLLGIKETWNFRKKIRKDLPNNRIMNVFHFEDGTKGLDEMIEFSDYIALSIPEFRFLGLKNKAYNISNYIKNKKPDIDIHLLGCTDNQMIKDLNFCTSSDSTSWLSLNRFGHFKYNDKTKTHTIKKSNINREKLLKKYKNEINYLWNKVDLKDNENLKFYYSCDMLQISYLLKQYTYYAGEQT